MTQGQFLSRLDIKCKKKNVKSTIKMTEAEIYLYLYLYFESLHTNFVRDFYGNSILVQCTDLSPCQLIQI